MKVEITSSYQFKLLPENIQDQIFLYIFGRSVEADDKGSEGKTGQNGLMKHVEIFVKGDPGEFSLQNVYPSHVDLPDCTCTEKIFPKGKGDKGIEEIEYIEFSAFPL